MARKPVVIDTRKCETLCGTMEHIANVTPELYRKLNTKDQKISGLKTHITKLIKLSLQQYEKYSIELFGKAQYEDYEKEDIDYLKSLIN